MGNSNSSEALDFEYNVTASDYTPVRKFQDFLLGEFFEIKHNTSDELLLMKVRVTSDKNQYQQMIESCFQRVSLLHKNLVKFHGYAGREASGTFSTTYKLYLYFNTLPKDLARIIKARKGTSSGTQRGGPKNYFSETELHRMMTQLIEVMEFLQTNGISHGDVRPEACFLGDDGTFKICDRRLLYEEELSYQAEKSSDKNYLFSPLALEAYVKGEKETRENRFKGDVFSVGMTLLECGTFRRSANIYEWGGQPLINKDSMYARLSEMQNRYSPRLVQIIAEMLRFEEPVRPDFIRVKRWLTGVEPVGIINSTSSPPRNHHKKFDSSPSRLKGSPSPGKSQYSGQQQFNKGTIGPKLSGAAPMGAFEQPIKVRQSPGKLSSKQLAKEDTQMDGSPLSSPITAHFARKATLGNEEDEVVEFETEETPKKFFPPGIIGHLDNSPTGLSHRVVDVSVLSSPYYPQHNALSNNLQSISPIKPTNPLPSDRYFFSGSQSQQSENKAQGHAGDVAVTDIKESTFGRADLKGLLGDFNKNDPKYTSSTSSPFQNTSTFGTSATTNNKASPVRVFAGENPLRATPSTSETFFNPKDPLLAPKNYSTGYTKADSGSLSNLTASTRNSEINRFGGSPQLDSPGKPYGLKIIAETPKASNQGSISHSNYTNVASPYLLSPIPQNNSPGLGIGGETHFYHNYHSPNIPMGSQNKLDTSLGYDHGIDPENWRSLVVDGMTYNSILSVGSEVSPMLGSQNDLLAQLQSKNNLNYQYSLSNADHILKGTSKEDKNYRGSRTSIDGLDGPEDSPTKLKHYVKSGYSMQGSRNNVMSGFQTPEEKQGYSSVPVTSRTGGYAVSQFKDLDMDERFKQAMERSKETFNMMKNNNWDTNLTNKIY